MRARVCSKRCLFRRLTVDSRATRPRREELSDECDAMIILKGMCRIPTSYRSFNSRPLASARRRW